MTNLAAEFMRPAPLPSPPWSKAPVQDASSAAFASAIAPFRSDLKADYATALADQALSSKHGRQSASNEAAQEAARSALEIGPNDSRLWLVLALLQAQSNPLDPRITESLKMSYLTGPSQAGLIPVRLDMATSNNSLKDSELRELAQGDVRAILTRYPDQRQTLLNDYVRATATGKTFLEESARTIDPKFADSLQSAK
ncbi:MAG: hypothetical protein ACREDL_17505 [Bradyrhizobium sp.]